MSMPEGQPGFACYPFSPADGVTTFPHAVQMEGRMRGSVYYPTLDGKAWRIQTDREYRLYCKGIAWRDPAK